MSTVSIYLNFPRNTEEAFNFYQSVFGGEFIGGIHRMGEVPEAEGQPALAEADKNLVMHVALPILGGFVLMGTDARSLWVLLSTLEITFTSIYNPTPERKQMRFLPSCLKGEMLECHYKKCFGVTTMAR